ncbi:VOC family protein [Ornithinimicrobium sp. F0845]|uniref:VOC family protein n=1 Tax=Ornithinimicrobium sp. F0845 TaxID=2926412 RepID=UPI001FF163E3|nr:VOC family protein [Ornithinimicrobium sp. F0845]MCK0112249.1 VOC family protein [Ornithinimicrobium sp. F0845]
MAIHLESWPAGTPCWVDLSVSDPDASRAFYADVLGWEFTESTEEFGGYFMALVDGQPAAGLAPPMPGMDDPGHYWTTYLGTQDIESVAQSVAEHGGSSIFPPMQLEALGSMGLFTDPTGAVFGAWQYGEHTGFNVYDTQGSVSWCEAMVDDFEKGKEFYASVFGFTYEDMSSDGMSYAMFSVPGGERPAGGIGVVDEGQSPYWSVTFNVASLDETLERARAAGSQVVMEPYAFEFGRVAVITGPDGEMFGVIEPPAEPPPM